MGMDLSLNLTKIDLNWYSNLNLETNIFVYFKMTCLPFAYYVKNLKLKTILIKNLIEI